MRDVGTNFHSVTPQAVRTALVDEIDRQEKALTIYTGEIKLDFHSNKKKDSDDDRTTSSIEYPVLGTFLDDSTKKPFQGIIEFENNPKAPHPRTPEKLFIGAVAMASLSDIFDRTDPAAFYIMNVHADLCQIGLNTPKKDVQQIFAVVLRAEVGVQHGIFVRIQYQVTVMSHLFKETEHGVTTSRHMKPIVVNSPKWNGTYDRIGPIRVHGNGEPVRDVL